jgi:seryl-tRNA synthetase
MLDLKFIRDNLDLVKKSLTLRRVSIDVDGLVNLDNQRRRLLTEVEELKRLRNEVSAEIGRLMREEKDTEKLKEKMRGVGERIKSIEEELSEIEQKINATLYLVPNVIHPSLPIGPNRQAAKVVRTWGSPKKFDFAARNHLELGEHLGILDFPRAAKISGSNFPLFWQGGARLVRALIDFMLELHTQKHGYTEVWPPSLVNRASMTGTGQLPKLEEDMYRLKDDDLFLIPTAEVPLTNLLRDEVLKAEELPIYLTAYTPCFRREAGSYGKDTKGLTRVHQFDKVEMVKFVQPEDSYDELEKLLANAEEVLQLLGLPYRVVLLASGDISFAASKCYDLEAYAAGSDTWYEVSSCSNFESFQARRANIRFRIKEGKMQFVHTLNGSGVALARTIICILENYQQPDGSVIIPEVLRKYMSGQEKIEAA